MSFDLAPSASPPSFSVVMAILLENWAIYVPNYENLLTALMVNLKECQETMDPMDCGMH